jgi:hypothetical protein
MDIARGRGSDYDIFYERMLISARFNGRLGHPRRHVRRAGNFFIIRRFKCPGPPVPELGNFHFPRALCPESGSSSSASTPSRGFATQGHSRNYDRSLAAGTNNFINDYNYLAVVRPLHIEKLTFAKATRANDNLLYDIPLLAKCLSYYLYPLIIIYNSPKEFCRDNSTHFTLRLYCS